MKNKFIYLYLSLILFLTACTYKIMENQTNNEYETSCSPVITENNTTQTTMTLKTDVSYSETSTAVSTRKVTITTAKKDLPDGELVRILDYIPDVVIDLRYATTNNFTGTVIYDDSEAYLCYGTVKKLSKVQDALKEKGFSIIVNDK